MAVWLRDEIASALHAILFIVTADEDIADLDTPPSLAAPAFSLSRRTHRPLLKP